MWMEHRHTYYKIIQHQCSRQELSLVLVLIRIHRERLGSNTVIAFSIAIANHQMIFNINFVKRKKKSYHGARSIIDRFTYIHNNRDSEYSTYFATITEIDEPGMEYPVGTRCIVLADGDADDYESIAFMTMDDNGMITKIKISTDGRYHFKIDE